MDKARFVINNRFIIDPELNYFKDIETGKETRLEPRLMDVLFFLASNADQLVTREQLIKVIWNNYGGADEGLNQAISFLRKLIHDTNKDIIETIPKKGYVLHAVIGKEPSEIKPMEATVPKHKKPGKKLFWIAGVLILILFAIWFIIGSISRSARSNKSPDVFQHTGKKGYDNKPVEDTSSSDSTTTGADVLKE